jgi:predicted CxxxxCH...CXXCH cytochrome family protein
MKLRSALLLVVAATVCALSGLISPQEAAASIDAVNQWPAKPTIASYGNAGTVTGNYTPGLGTNRLLLVAVATRYSALPGGTPAITVNFGGVGLTAGPTTANVQNGVALFYLPETNIGSGTKSLSVTNTTTGSLTNMFVSAAVYNGVYQTTPITGSGALGLAANAVSVATSYTMTANQGLAGNNGLSVYVTNWNGNSNPSSVAGYTEIRDYAGLGGATNNINLAAGYKVTVGASAETLTSTATSALGGIAGVGLNPALRLYQIGATSCGDCHGNPPEDGPTGSRNVWPGQFPGSHDKHAGKNEGQYGQLCTQCHRNNTTTNHTNGFKNVSGTSVPRTSGGYTGNGNPTSNSPTFGTCSNVICHSNGRLTPKQYATTPTWGTPAAKPCLACHGGRDNVTNLYAKSSPNNFALSTTHSQHLGKYTVAQINCNTCHGKTAANNTALKDYSGAIYHANGGKTVLFTNVAYGSYTSYKTNITAGNYKKCTNVACHGGTTRAAWSENAGVNNDNTCVHCHGAAGTLATVPNSGTNRRFFAPGWGTGANKGISTDGTASSNDFRVGSHFKHLSSVYMKAIKCNECHRVPSNPFDVQHTDSPRYNSQTLTFAQASTATIAIGVGSSATPAQLAAFAGYTNGTSGKAATCSSVYCHGNRLKNSDTGGANIYRRPYWNYSAMINYSDPTVACGRCHGNPPASVSGSHLGKAPTISCSGCHGSVVNSQGQIINKNLHINGRVEGGSHEWSFGGLRHKPASLGGIGSITANTVYPYTNCNTCHTTATGGIYPPARGDATLVVCTTCHLNSANFQGATPGCWDCHGTGATAANATPSSNAFPNISGSHSVHVTTFAYTCADCHSGGGTGTAVHGNYSGKSLKTKANVVVKLTTATAGTAANSTWVSASQTWYCSSTVCHGQKSPDWGQAVPSQQCRHCHGSQTLTYANYSDATVAPGGTNIDTGRVAGVTRRGGLHQEHLNANIVTPNKVKCNACHTVPSAVNHAKLDNRTTALVKFGGIAITSPRGSASVTRVGGLITCNNTWCHVGVTNSGASAPAPVWNDSAYLTGAGGAAALVVADCKKCHDLPPASSGSHGGIPNVTAFPIGASNCGSNCHSLNLTTGTTYATIFTDSTKHINGIVEGGDCTSCHASVQGNRAPVVGQFASQSHHIQGAETLTKQQCYQCHWEADINGNTTAYHGGSANPGAGVVLVVYNASTRPTAFTPGVTYITYTANGKRAQIAKLNTVCLGCHNSQFASNKPFGSPGTYTTDQYSPEQRLTGSTLNKSKTSILSRYSSSRLVQWSMYDYSSATGGAQRFGTNNKSQITKALSAHGNAVKNQFPQWDPAAGGTGDDSYQSLDIAASATLSGNRNVLCYDCHNSHGSDAAGITSSYSSATGRYKGGLLKSTVQGRGGYTVTYKPAARTINYKNYSTTSTTAALFNPGASICNDCHNNDTRKVNISKPWSITGTYSSTKAIVGYWSTPYFDNYTFASAMRTDYKKGGALGTNKDLRKPMGGHFGTSAFNDSVSNHANSPAQATINGLCTPCHDPHGVSNALGANRDRGVPLLKGTWVTSPYREDKADILVKRGGGSTFAGFNASGAVPGYHIDQNTFMSTPIPFASGAAVATSKSGKRNQRFRSFSNLSSAQTGTNMPNLTYTTFGGLCNECHSQLALTNTASGRPASGAAWMSKERVHQSVSNWASSTLTGTDNQNNRHHAYTCAKCHTPHVSRLPRLLVTNCLDVRHFGQNRAGGVISTVAGTTTPGNMLQSLTGGTPMSTVTSASGAGRFPSGGSRYSGLPGTAQNPGGWWFQTNGATNAAQPGEATGGTTVDNFGSTQCHNSGTAGGAAYDPTKQIWNKKSRW